MMSRAGDRISESFETAWEPFSRHSKSSDCPIGQPAGQTADQAVANKLPTYPKSLARNPSQAILPPQIAQQSSANSVGNNGRGSAVELLAPPPTSPFAVRAAQPLAENTSASHRELQPINSVPASSLRPESAPAPIAPPEPLPAQSVSQSRAITPTAAIATTPNSRTVTNAAVANTTNATSAVPANTTWCRVRVRNVSNQPATQVSLSVTSPANAQLLASDGGATSLLANGRMDFAQIPQVGPNEEVIVTVGVSAADKQSNRLRVQVRDAQGGTNQEVQSRWKVILEAAEQP
jgi:hypothetical protein